MIAAGASRRLGQPKQLVTYKGKTLINHTIDILKQSTLDEVIVVLGCEAQKIGESIQEDVRQVTNEDWASGLGTSIASGIHSLDDSFDGVLISLVDQYRTNSDLIYELISMFHNNPNKLVVCRYGNDVVGPPAIFPKRLFSQLAKLEGDRGAGKVIKMEKNTASDQVIEIYFENGHFDVDTVEDLENLKP